MVTLGLLQYLAPILQFALGVLWFDEDMPAGRWIGFVLVWLRSGDLHRRGASTPPASAAAADRRGLAPSERPGSARRRLVRSLGLSTTRDASGGAGGDDVGEGLERVADRTRRAATRAAALASLGAGDDVGAGLVHGRVLAQQVERLGVPVVVGEVAVEQLEQPGVGRVGATRGPSAPAGSARPRAGRCRASCRTRRTSEAMSRMSSESWKAMPTISPYAVSASSTSRAAPPKQGAVPGRGGDQRAGLAGDDAR